MLLFVLILLCGIFSSTMACPSGDWSSCAAESGTCTTATATIVAFGAGSEWSYVPVSAGSSTCDASTFGDANSASAGSRECCTLTNTALAGAFPLSPVVNEISCGEEAYEFFPSTSITPQPHYWRLELTEQQAVYISNCESSSDTKMQLMNEDGTEVGTGCSGDDCSGVCTTGLREEFTVNLAPGVYFVRTQFFGDGSGLYHMTVSCGDIFIDYVDQVLCDSETVDYLDASMASPRFWKFELSQATSVYFGNCDSEHDTTLRVYDDLLQPVNTGCGGDDCGSCASFLREEFSVDLEAGVYYVATDWFSSSSSGTYRLIVNCASYDCLEYGATLSTPHACSCQPQCNGPFCNGRDWVENRLGVSTGVPDADLCEDGATCCCSCPNCAGYVAA